MKNIILYLTLAACFFVCPILGKPVYTNIKKNASVVSLNNYVQLELHMPDGTTEHLKTSDITMKWTTGSSFDLVAHFEHGAIFEVSFFVDPRVHLGPILWALGPGVRPYMRLTWPGHAPLYFSSKLPGHIVYQVLPKYYEDGTLTDVPALGGYNIVSGKVVCHQRG